MKLDRNGILARIPHQGSMCLLDGVLDWDGEQAVCRATSHTQPANPLRHQGLLGVSIGIEYAAQAMAVHGALVPVAWQPSNRPVRGYLTSVRDVRWQASGWAAVQASALLVKVMRQSAAAGSVLYAFELTSESGEPVMSGRATVMLDAGEGA